MLSTTVKGEVTMAYETKVILSLLANSVGRAQSVEEAYTYIVEAANVEGLKLPDYDDFLKKLQKESNKRRLKDQ